MIKRDLCSRKLIDERSGVTTWTMNLILRSKKQPTNIYERGFLPGKNKRNGVATQTRNELKRSCWYLMKRSKWCQKMLNLPTQTRDERSGVTTWTINLILRSKKQPKNRYERGFLPGKNKRNGVATQTRNELKRSCCMWKIKWWKRSKWCQKMLNLPAQTRDEKDERMMRNESMNVAETPGTEKLSPRQWRQKMLVFLAQTNDRKMNDEW